LSPAARAASAWESCARCSREKAVEQVAIIDLKLAPRPADLNDRVHGFTADATDERQVHAALEAITAKLGPHADVLCNNAGGGEAKWIAPRTLPGR
jgi:NAD(P)-dependent dehydrogenase (short-subunit alcohol dehydrogenase family)